MKAQLELEKEMGQVLWRIFHEFGKGDIMKGRALAVLHPPEQEDWESAVMKCTFPKHSHFVDYPDDAIHYARRQYAEALVSLCLDAYWYEHGMPVIELGHKLAASLLLTRVPDDVLKTVKLPFKSFRIVLPDGLLSFEEGAVKHIKVGDHVAPDDKDKTRDPVMTTALAVRAERGGSYSIGADVYTMLSTTDVTADPEHPVLEADKLKLPMVARLIASVCLYMTGDRDEFPYKKMGKGHGWKGHAREPGPPTQRIYRLTREVKHNFKELVRDVCEGRSTKQTVQYVVTGHWRNQACGPKLAQHKRIFIEPYWKGPRDAPIAQRAHKLEESKHE